MEFKNTLRKKLIAIAIIAIIIISLYVYYDFDSDKIDVENDNEENKWKEYPYTIPGTSITFPDAEEKHGDDEATWITILLKLEFLFITREPLYVSAFYHKENKEYFIVDGDERYGDNKIFGKTTLGYSGMDMVFKPHYTSSEEIFDEFYVLESKPFQYKYNAVLGRRSSNPFTFNLSIDANKPPSTMYDGKVKVNPNKYFKLYDLTDCNVTGTVERGENKYNVKGSCFIEHEWGKNFWDGEWDYMAVWDNDIDFELHIANGSSGSFSKSYIMYVTEDNEIHTIDDLNVDVLDVYDVGTEDGKLIKEIRFTSESFGIDITIIVDDSMKKIYREPTYYTGFGTISGTVDGMEINTDVYIECIR